jgi:hypothetical protein
MKLPKPKPVKVCSVCRVAHRGTCVPHEPPADLR